MLEDALELLPLMWGKGAPAYSGRTIEVAEAVCYPRPLQDHVPILVGGSGERTDAAGSSPATPTPATCSATPTPCAARWTCSTATARTTGRDPAEIAVTVLSTADAPSTEDHVGRYRAFAEAGVDRMIVNFPELTSRRAAHPVRRGHRRVPPLRSPTASA